MLSLIFGIIFGFIDNIGLWFGISKLEKYMYGGTKMKAALGNTYSDGMGALVGTCISIIAKDLYNYDDNDDKAPLWVDPIGIVIGCLIGIFIGKLL